MPLLRKLGTFVVLLIISVCVAIPALAFQNEPDGFRGIKWGTDISELSDMTLVEDDGDSKCYRRSNDEMKIGSADLDRIIYCFYKNRFSGVAIYFTGFRNFTKLKDTFSHHYGRGDKPSTFLEEYFWYGASVSIVFNYMERREKGKIQYSFYPYGNEEEKDLKEKVKKGGKGL